MADRLDAPDGGFETRVKPYLEDRQTIYVAHAPEKAVFQGRAEAMAGWSRGAAGAGSEQIRIAQRSGEAVFIVHRFLLLHEARAIWHSDQRNLPARARR